MTDAREHDVTMCSEECGWTRWSVLVSRWLGHSTIQESVGYCEKCGTRVGIDERGPWREAMVPRAALEQAQAEADTARLRAAFPLATIEQCIQFFDWPGAKRDEETDEQIVRDLENAKAAFFAAQGGCEDD